MKIVIQCAASKDPAAGYFQSATGKRVTFVAHPELASAGNDCLAAHPDDTSDQPGKSWRELVAAYNARPGKNPLGLFPAYRLYANDTYRALVDRYGVENVYVLSAGWGLIRADFLTPQYDVTFKKQGVDPFKRRLPSDRFCDFNQLPDNGDDIVFFGGKDYLPFFCHLTGSMRSRRLVFYNSQSRPIAPGCVLIRYETKTRTNWHYACARGFAAEEIRLP